MSNLNVVGHRRDLFKMPNVVAPASTLSSLPKQPSALAKVARIYEQGNFLGTKNANIYEQPQYSVPHQIRN